ncbi:sisters on the loose [Cochliomyia hominivorax]
MYVCVVYACIVLKHFHKIAIKIEASLKSLRKNYQNPIFALTPKDFEQETLKSFLKNMKELFLKANLVQKYILMKYVMEAYEKVLRRFEEISSSNQKEIRMKQTKTKSKDKHVQKLTKNVNERISSPIVRGGEAQEDNGEALDLEIPIEMEDILFSSQNDSIDLLQIFQQDFKVRSDEDNLRAMDEINMQEFQNNISLLSPSPQLPAMNISDLFENDYMNSSDDLQLSFIRQPQQEQEESMRIPIMEQPRRSERIQNLQNVSYDESEEAIQSRHSYTSNLLRYRSQAAAQNIQNLSYTPLETNTRRPQPRTFITEEEYSLRFRLPRRTFLEISELPHVKYNIETSHYSYFPMDMTLIDEEYLYMESSSSTNNIVTVQSQQLPRISILAPSTFASLTPSVLTATGENLSSLNVVRQAPSSMMDISSFARPLLTVQEMDISRIEEERSHGIPQNISEVIEPVGIVNTDVNVSIDSVSSIGGVAASGEYIQPQLQQPIIVNEAINLLSIERPQQITTDSGINLPNPQIVLTDSAVVLPSDVSSVLQTAPRDQRKPPEPVSTDTGIFKTPMIPQTTATLPSVEERVFQTNLKSRILDVSTPLKGFDETFKSSQTRKTLLLEIETQAANVTDVSSKDDITNENVEIEQHHVVTSGLNTLQQGQLGVQNLQPIEEVRESNIRPSTQFIGATNGGLNNEHNQNLEINQVLPNDDYRKDWYEILRARLQNIDYKNAASIQRKPKHRLRRPAHNRQPLTERIMQQEPPEHNTSHNNNNETSSLNLLQQTITRILPPPEVPVDLGNQNLNVTTSSGNSTDGAVVTGHVPLALGISNQQLQYDQFVLNNAENITTIMENLNSCRIMLDNHRRGLESKLRTGTFNQPCQHYDLTVLLNASKQRLAIKLDLLQNIIRQVSFDVTKCDCVNDRMSAAIGFAFLLELKSAGIIHLSDDGRTVSLC